MSRRERQRAAAQARAREMARLERDRSAWSRVPLCITAKQARVRGKTVHFSASDRLPYRSILMALVRLAPIYGHRKG
jgi:hypothetical protein